MLDSNEPVLPRTDVSGSEFEVGPPTGGEVAKRKSLSKRAPKSLLTAVFENWLLSILHCRFLIISVAHFASVLQVMPKQFQEFLEMRMCRLA